MNINRLRQVRKNRKIKICTALHCIATWTWPTYTSIGISCICSGLHIPTDCLLLLPRFHCVSLRGDNCGTEVQRAKDNLRTDTMEEKDGYDYA
jgi:hypothetical protein